MDCEVPNYTTLRCSCCMNNTLGSIQLLNSLSDNCYFSGKEIWKIQLKLLLKQLFFEPVSTLCVEKNVQHVGLSSIMCFKTMYLLCAFDVFQPHSKCNFLLSISEFKGGQTCMIFEDLRKTYLLIFQIVFKFTRSLKLRIVKNWRKK